MRLLTALVSGAIWAAGALAHAAPAVAPARVDIPHAGGVLHGLLYKPDGNGPFQAVIALHGCHGLIGRSGQILPLYQDWAEHLLKAGNAVLFPDSYGSRNLGPQCHEKSHRTLMRRERVRDIEATRHWLVAQPWVSAHHVGLLGWANGASALLWAVRPQLASSGASPDFRSAVALYPDCRLSSRLGWSARVPTLLLIGGKDGLNSPAVCRQMIDDARGRSALARIVVYPGADHDFDATGVVMHVAGALKGAGPRFHADPKARTDALKRVAEWLAR
ncbi:MAG TPA: dienelactone hydrolase family protein [Nitrobacter sp.]|nr:dienelactone hydrolase family protein [Nitrobacter sp.]